MSQRLAVIKTYFLKPGKCELKKKPNSFEIQNELKKEIQELGTICKFHNFDKI